jgi:cytochrome P450
MIQKKDAMETSLTLDVVKTSPTPKFLWEFMFNPLNALTNLARENGDIAHVKIRNRDFFLLNHPEFIEQVLVKQQHNFIKGPALQRTRLLLGEGLLTSEGKAHTEQRRSLQPAFHPQRVDAYVSLMSECVQADLSHWQNGQRVDMNNEMMHLTLDIALQTLFGASPAGMTERVRRATTTLARLFPLANLPLLDSARAWFPNFKRAIADLNAVTAELIANPQVAQAKYALINILRENKDQFTDEQIRSHVLTFLLAGHETTSLLLAWCWDMLAHHPHIQAGLQAEADRVLGDRLPTPEDLEKLTYTRAVVKETLRLRPPAWTIGRQALNDCQISEYYLPAGSVALVSQWVTHHDPRYYDAPDEFRPERWNPATERSLPRFAYFPFGGGSRVCIGEHFAWTEAVLVLALTARRWQVAPVHENLVTPQPSVTLRPKNGIAVILEKRNI